MLFEIPGPHYHILTHYTKSNPREMSKEVDGLLAALKYVDFCTTSEYTMFRCSR